MLQFQTLCLWGLCLKLFIIFYSTLPSLATLTKLGALCWSKWVQPSFKFRRTAPWSACERLDSAAERSGQTDSQFTDPPRQTVASRAALCVDCDAGDRKRRERGQPADCCCTSCSSKSRLCCVYQTNCPVCNAQSRTMPQIPAEHAVHTPTCRHTCTD